jgi:phage terminase large subunit
MPQPQITQEQFSRLHDHYLLHPDEFVHDVIGSRPWQKQSEIICDVFRYKYVAVASCNAAGKSDVAGDIALAFLLLLANSIVITTAPTWRQVKDVLWRYIRTKYKKAPYKLSDAECNQVGLDLNEEWYAIGLSTTESEKFFGYHADNILVIVDEASGVDEKIFVGVDAVTPNVNAHVLAIGNPTNPSGRFYKMMNDPLVKRHRITVFDTPNFTANGIHTLEDLLSLFTPPAGINEQDELEHIDSTQKSLKMPIAALISPDTVYRRYREWGTDSPNWQALIMAEFPSQAEQALFPADLVRMAMEMNKIDEDSGKTYAEISGWDIPYGAPEYGQDMARYGGDTSVCFPRRGGWVDDPISWAKTDLMTSADKILNIIDPLDFNVRLNIDDTGNGGGTTDRLRQKSAEERGKGAPIHQYNLVAYNFSSKVMMTDAQRDQFHDITSLLYWNLRKWLIKKQISLPKNERLFNELIARRWFLNKSGKIQVESKDDYKKRTGAKSPDFSDALALAFAGGLRHVQKRVPEEHVEEEESFAKPYTSGLSRHGW